MILVTEIWRRHHQVYCHCKLRRRVLDVDVLAFAIQHHSARAEPDFFDEAQVDTFADKALDRFRVVVV